LGHYQPWGANQRFVFTKSANYIMKAVYFPLSLFLLAGMLVFSACREDPPPPPPGPTTEDPMSKLDLTPYELNLPPHFPQFPIPEDNDLTVAKVELGKKLFTIRYFPLTIRFPVLPATCNLMAFLIPTGSAWG
jgi:hypothetical protein